MESVVRAGFVIHIGTVAVAVVAVVVGVDVIVVVTAVVVVMTIVLVVVMAVVAVVVVCHGTVPVSDGWHASTGLTRHTLLM